MKNDELFEIIGDISDRHIEGAKRKKPKVWKTWAAAAACLCVIVAAAFMITLRVPQSNFDSGSEPDYREDDYPVDNGISNFGASETSDKYNSLTELLADLSRNDYHDSTLDSNGGRSLSSAGDSVTHGAKAAAYNGYVYRIADGYVEITDFDGDVKNTIDFAAHELFISGDRLVLRGGRTVGNELEYESYSIIRTYTLRDPANPEFLEKYEQKGELVACYMAGDKIYLLTTDGVCACGYSRLSDLSGYVPTFDGEPWSEKDITILGEPASVNYLAVSAVEMAGGVSSMRAFYGDITNVFYGENWIAVETQSRTDKQMTQPEVYTFDESLTYTGKLDLAEMAKIVKNIDISGGTIPDGKYLNITAVSKTGDVFNCVGVFTQIIDGENTQQVFAAAKNMTTDRENVEFVDVGTDVCSIDDIYSDGNKSIICVSAFDRDDIDNMGSRYVIVEFDDTDMLLYLAEFTTDTVDGVDNYYAYGSPYGSLKTIIPMENGIYLRFNGVPDGFDIFDFSGSITPKLIYRSNGEIPDDERFDFTWHKLDENIFGVMHMKMGEGEEIRESEFSYRIYAVDPDSTAPFTLLNEYAFDNTQGPWTSNLEFEVFEYEGEYYFVSAYSEGITKLEW